MLSSWPIRKKLLAASFLLASMVFGLSFGGFRGVYAYRSLVKGVSRRAAELPLASRLAERVSDMRVTLSRLDSGLRYPIDSPGQKELDRITLRHKFDSDLIIVSQMLSSYREILTDNETMRSSVVGIGKSEHEWESVRQIEATLKKIRTLQSDEDWIFAEGSLTHLEKELDKLHSLTIELPVFLHKRMSRFAIDVRGRYRTWIVLTWVTSLSGLIIMFVMGHQFYRWVFQPLRTLIRGSRLVAAGDFNHRIQLDSQDEMRELSEAMNNMTKSFRDIRDDLDVQVRARTREVVQSERLASVGFLAAGVAHEINNPLASIALCAESLEDRLRDVLVVNDDSTDGSSKEDIGVVHHYLQMIQKEAFRCKDITERLLDFSRISEVEKHNADLNEVVQDVIDMIGHIGKYKEKQIDYQPASSIVAAVNPQEFKQVVLNLLTNALDSLERGGRVQVKLTKDRGQAILAVKDDGCGMSPEVREHLFEPFFTRRRDGQGTGLGLSITYRIITDHGGRIEAKSDGPGTGSELIVCLPLADQPTKELDHRYHQVA